jgi:5-carboxymethyl-2-hydroxymuconate isomerase
MGSPGDPRPGLDLGSPVARALPRPAVIDRAFVHLTLAVLDRRSAEAQRAAGELSLGLVHKAFAATGLDCDVTVEVREMRAALYFKARSASRA